MHRTDDIRSARLRRWLEQRVKPGSYDDSRPAQLEVLHVPGEPIAAEDALAGRFEPYAVGEPFGPAWATSWFRFSASVPAEWAGREVVAVVAIEWLGEKLHPTFAGEAMVWDGKQPVRGLSYAHDEHVITARAAGGEPVELYLEASAIARPPAGAPVWPLLLPEPDGPPLYRVSQARLATVRRDIRELYLTGRLLLDLAESLPPDDVRGQEVFAALTDACNQLETAGPDADVETVAASLHAVLTRPAAPSALHAVAVGHAHIDTAWLWPIRETVRKVARTFASALALMDANPDYRFVASQAQHYAWMHEHYPTLFERIRTKVRAGQWEPVGAMWVEPDCNLPSGESLVRQLLHGQRFWIQEFGRPSNVVWLPDAFGFPASLPQLARGAGAEGFMTAKLSWSQLNPFPHHTFAWEGIDGTRIAAHEPPSHTYSGTVQPAQLTAAARRFREAGREREFLYPFGIGDGGGGPTREMVESVQRLGDVEGAPRVAFGSAREFFARLAERVDALPVWSGELYLELHRGTYTTHARTKQANRRAEQTLRAAELWGCFAGSLDADARRRLADDWTVLLVQQFHDILPGSGINWVYRDAEKALAAATEDAAEIDVAARRALGRRMDTAATASPVAVFNAAPHESDDVVVLPSVPAGARSATGPDGAHAPLQRLGDGSAMFRGRVPAAGYSVFDLTAHAPDDRAVAATATERRLENDLLRVEWDSDGLITSILDKRIGREVVAPGRRANLFQLHHDHPNNWDAWDVDLHYEDVVEDVTALESLEVVETGPVRAAVRLVRRFGASRIMQDIRLGAGSPVVEFATTVDWRERHRFLKVAFPVDVRSPAASYEIQFGHVSRPTHRNTSWELARFEVCGQRWADLSEAGYGVALLNDCKYGYDVRGNVLRLSLLRSPTWPDPEADQGEHQFRYGLLPHRGALAESDVVRRAIGFNLRTQPLALSSGTRGDLPARLSFLHGDDAGAVVEAVKPAEDDGAVVVRVYDALGGRRAVRLRTAARIRTARRVDLLERDLGTVPVTDNGVVLELGPFEVATLKLTFEGETR
jgi:alpha-mannosidase